MQIRVHSRRVYKEVEDEEKKNGVQQLQAKIVNQHARAPAV